MSISSVTPAETDNGIGEPASEVARATVTRLNVNINADTANALRAIAEVRGITYTEAVRRAIAVYKFIEDEVLAGHKVQSVDNEAGKIRELVLM